jgi:HK97 family phage major capsid protein
MLPNELRPEYTRLLAETEALLDLADHEDRALSGVEQRRYDTNVARLTEIKDNAGTREPVSRGLQPSNAPDDTDVLELDARRSRRVPTFHPGAKLQAFANNREGHAEAYRSAAWLRAALLGDSKSMTWCDKNGVWVDVRAAHSAGENAKGGVLVPEQFSATILRLVDEYGVFRRNTRVIPMSSDTLNIPRRTSGLVANYVGENVDGSAGESDTTWDNVSLVAKKLMVLTRMSSEVAEDALVSMVDMLAIECALAFALKEDTCGFTGTGAATDGGIVGVLVKALQASFTKAKVAAASTHDTLAEIDSEDIIKLMAAIPQYAKARSKFYCSPVALELVFNSIKAAAGGNSLENLAKAVAPQFLGYPIELSEVFPGDAAATYNGLAMIGFGNLAQASTLGNRRDIRFATTDARYWEQDQVGVKATLRHDINVHSLGSTTVKSPFAVLVGTT